MPGDVQVEDGTIAAVGLAGGGTGIAAPGFVDLQVNGYGGVDLLGEPERWREVDASLAELGVTTWQPTLITAPPDAGAACAGGDRAGRPSRGPLLSRTPGRAPARAPARARPRAGRPIPRLRTRAHDDDRS